LEKITINTDTQKSEILIGESLTSVKRYLPGSKVVIITDDNVFKLYGNRFPEFPIICIAPGEKSKRLEVIGNLAEKLLGFSIDRNAFLLGIGGGVVCDITGFLASIYMRGIKFGFVSTTLLSQVDASTGGKNGINLGTVKNVLGVFRQPEFVICDPSMLLSLPEDEYKSGLGELIKTGMIRDAGLITEIEQNFKSISGRENELLIRLIFRSIENKAEVVREDEKEKGLRMILNFGHTFGHVIETLAGIKHGLAITAGMMIAVDISVENGLLAKSERDRFKSLVLKYDLLREYRISDDKFEKFILMDKKKSDSDINFVMLERIGKSVVKRVPVKKLIESYRRVQNKP
jgi:3-dehydroquinate synthase